MLTFTRLLPRIVKTRHEQCSIRVFTILGNNRVNAYFHTIVAKNCKNPNAALLMSGWLASPEGQVMFDTIGRRGSPMVEGTEIERMVKEAGAKVYFNSWEFTAEMAQQYSKEVIEAWGFPTPRKK